MYQSEQINELATALCKCQSEMQFAVKDSKNPHFNSRYADLSAVWDAVREPLTKNNLCVTQTVQFIDGKTVLVSMLMHNSGQWIKSYLPIKTDKDTCQGWGSGITYARRYSLAALVGCVQDDDDGNAAEPDANSKKKPKESKASKEEKEEDDTPPTEKELDDLMKLKAKCDPNYTLNIDSWLNSKGINGIKNITNRQTYKSVLNGLTLNEKSYNKK